MNGKSIIYWDACVFIAWLKNEQRAPGEMENLQQVVSQIDNKNIILLTSTIIRTEILDCTLSSETKEKFTQLLKRQNFQEKVINQRISSLAHDLRNFYKTSSPSFFIRTPDALHLATAIHYQADEFHTFDKGLLRLELKKMEHRLIICKPQMIQSTLPGMDFNH